MEMGKLKFEYVNLWISILHSQPLPKRGEVANNQSISINLPPLATRLFFVLKTT